MSRNCEKNKICINGQILYYVWEKKVYFEYICVLCLLISVYQYTALLIPSYKFMCINYITQPLQFKLTHFPTLALEGKRKEKEGLQNAWVWKLRFCWHSCLMNREHAGKIYSLNKHCCRLYSMLPPYERLRKISSESPQVEFRRRGTQRIRIKVLHTVSIGLRYWRVTQLSFHLEIIPWF